MRADQPCLSRRRSRPERQLGLLRIRGNLLDVRQNFRNHFRLPTGGKARMVPRATPARPAAAAALRRIRTMGEPKGGDALSRRG